jgi:LmbE family N-acetylglucosaminyl deacetylase
VAELLVDVPKRALAIYAHPDDPDVSCGGTMAAWAKAGCEVPVVLCTDGGKGSPDPGVDPRVLAERGRPRRLTRGRCSVWPARSFSTTRR